MSGAAGPKGDPVSLSSLHWLSSFCSRKTNYYTCLSPTPLLPSFLCLPQGPMGMMGIRGELGFEGPMVSSIVPSGLTTFTTLCLPETHTHTATSQCSHVAELCHSVRLQIIIRFVYPMSYIF